MKVSDFEKEYIIKTKLEFENTEGYIVLREPTEDELLDFAQYKDDELKLSKYIINNLVPACLIEHNFEYDDGKALNKGDVVKLISKSGKKMQRTIKTWFNSFADIEPEVEEDSNKKK